jgi:hypothetical protein
VAIRHLVSSRDRVEQMTVQEPIPKILKLAQQVLHQLE